MFTRFGGSLQLLSYAASAGFGFFEVEENPVLLDKHFA
jgi:hypothetical protein